MRRLLLMAAMTAATALAGPAQSYPLSDCFASVFNIRCMPRATNPDARILDARPYQDDSITDADRASWAERCKPRKVFDGLSIRWTYAEKGCSVGPLHLE